MNLKTGALEVSNKKKETTKSESEFVDPKCVNEMDMRSNSTDVLKEWQRAIEIEIKTAKELGFVPENTRRALSTGLEDSSEQLKRGEISFEEYSSLRKQMLEEK